MHAPSVIPSGAAMNVVKRLGAIDVGTNSLRLTVVEASPDASYRVLDDERFVTRLGRGMAETGRLHPEAVEASAQVIARMKTIAEGRGVSMLRVIGTCAVREASNGPEFCELIRQRTGLTLTPISAQEEARLAVLGLLLIGVVRGFMRVVRQGWMVVLSSLPLDGFNMRRPLNSRLGGIGLHDTTDCRNDGHMVVPQQGYRKL